MIFYNSSTKQGICQEIDRLCDSTDDSYPRLDKTSRVNESLQEVIGMLIHADGTWQFDDQNYTDIPEGTITLVQGQAAYTFNDELLSIEEVLVLPAGGTLYRHIDPIDVSELGVSWDDYFGGATGFPQYYDKLSEDTVRLGPAPTSTAVTLAAGLKVRYKRKAQNFTAVSTTATDSTEPGFASPWHVVLAYMAAIPYNEIYHKDRVARQEKKKDELLKTLLAHYGKREQDVRQIMTPKLPNHF